MSDETDWNKGEVLKSIIDYLSPICALAKGDAEKEDLVRTGIRIAITAQPIESSEPDAAKAVPRKRLGGKRDGESKWLRDTFRDLQDQPCTVQALHRRCLELGFQVPSDPEEGAAWVSKLLRKNSNTYVMNPNRTWRPKHSNVTTLREVS
jgi:hypothetical protein